MSRGFPGRVSQAQDLCGREADRAAIGEFLCSQVLRGAADCAQDLDTADDGQCLVLAGEAGVGKSSLLRVASEIADEAGHTVLLVAGIQAESQVPFAGIHRLLRPVMAMDKMLPAPQRGALRTALGLEDGPAPTLFLVGLATLTLLTEQSEHAPVTVLVDDLQWLDESSQNVLAFVARRLGDDQVRLVTTIRTGLVHHFAEVPSLVRPVRPVDDAAAEQILLRARATLSGEDRTTILALARGNPLALVELSSTWPGMRAGARATDAEMLVVPTSERLQRAFAGRARSLPPATCDLLLVAALTDAEELAEILPATSELIGHAVSADVADPAVLAGLVDYDGTHLRFRHPLIRSAIAAAESPGRHQKAYRALADVLAAQPDRQVRFLAAAAAGPDEAVAAALAEQAEGALRRGAVLDAVANLERAARLTPDPEVRGRRILLAAEHAFGLGRSDLVRKLVGEAAAAPLSELDQARRTWLTEIFDDGDPGDSMRVAALCATGMRSAATGEVDLALNLLYGAAVRCWWSGAGPTTRAPVVDSLRLLDRSADPRVTVTLAVADPVESGADVARALSDAPVVATDDADTWRALGQAAWAIGDCVRCVDLLDKAAALMRAQGRLGVLAHVLSIQANGRVTLGEWTQAEEGAIEAQRLAKETGQPIWATGSASVAWMLAGLKGEPCSWADLTVDAERYAYSRGLADQLACVCLVRAFAHAGSGRYEQAYGELAKLFDPASPYHHEREAFHGLMFLAETATHVGRVPEAREVLNRMEEVAAATPSPLLRAHLLYARPVLAAPADAEPLYLKALGEDLTRWPWIRARIELAYGTWLRRQRRVVDSREPLRSAHDRLVRIGAQHWVDRATSELRAAGERPPEATSPAADLLSPQELQIARLAAQGLSNRDIAEQLFCSARTVASHLYHVFPKLGVTSRVQLASRLENPDAVLHQMR